MGGGACQAAIACTGHPSAPQTAQPCARLFHSTSTCSSLPTLSLPSPPHFPPTFLPMRLTRTRAVAQRAVWCRSAYV